MTHVRVDYTPDWGIYNWWHLATVDDRGHAVDDAKLSHWDHVWEEFFRMQEELRTLHQNQTPYRPRAATLEVPLGEDSGAA